jgi:hypothetical protein
MGRDRFIFRTICIIVARWQRQITIKTTLINKTGLLWDDTLKHAARPMADTAQGEVFVHYTKLFPSSPFLATKTAPKS